MRMYVTRYDGMHSELTAWIFFPVVDSFVAEFSRGIATGDEWVNGWSKMDKLRESRVVPIGDAASHCLLHSRSHAVFAQQMELGGSAGQEGCSRNWESAPR